VPPTKGFKEQKKYSRAKKSATSMNHHKNNGQIGLLKNYFYLLASQFQHL